MIKKCNFLHILCIVVLAILVGYTLFRVGQSIEKFDIDKNPIPSRWLGINIMPRNPNLPYPTGYSIECLNKIIQQGIHLNLRTNLSSYINPASNLYWESDLRSFMDANSGMISLYTCLKWKNESDLQEMAKLPYLTHLQINQGTWGGDPGPISQNPTEDKLCTLSGFNADEYVAWMGRVDSIVPKRVVMVIPFNWANSENVKSDCFRKIMMKAKEITQNGRKMGLEVTMYPVWISDNPKPDAATLENLLLKKQGNVDLVNNLYGTNLHLIIAETGWAAHVSASCRGTHTPYTPENSYEWWKTLCQYVPTVHTDIRLYYWQFFDTDNGDGCGKTWGIVDKDSCTFSQPCSYNLNSLFTGSGVCVGRKQPGICETCIGQFGQARAVHSGCTNQNIDDWCNNGKLVKEHYEFIDDGSKEPDDPKPVCAGCDMHCTCGKPGA
jgi:hypothetical protein